MGRMEVDRNGLEVLDHSEALRLLGRATIGRIGIHSGALPVVLPVNFVLDGDRIVVRTGTGTKLDAATRNAVVAFEVDEIDPDEHTGWSVLVVGTSCDASDVELTPHQRMDLARWGPAVENCIVAISLERVSGRRLVRARRA